MSKYKKYTQEYRDEAVKMVLENDQPIAKVARDLGINEGTLGNWVIRYRAENPEPVKALSPLDAARLAEVEEENRRLRMENEFLKKATAFFAKKSQ